ncbi:5'-AMP-activated serine/threonine-protein kinase catalytic subunit alpha [Chrysoperla carnea]|uniref:5'-AMP-activated serine/threonine-protein kinase catalytic subunit alpha n=1 Tax=Chrysoperla carnea TaxID=189513 RepID=UPI001D07AE69|nr:5'-AMP-activated serine/threonine-protein kinase catalytic subunit alpha [Chrysoperla carnea]
MANHLRKSLSGSIHRIREFELEKVNLAEEFDILQIVGEGWFGKILLVEHRATDTEMVLKALPKAYSALRDFYREFHYNLHLGAHKHIITTYDVAFETAGFYVFSQEYAPLGDLTSNLTDNGIGELHTKRVAKQLTSALEHLHARELVHRDVKLDNILIFKSDFSRIKLCDFGETRRVGTVVRRRNEWLPYAPPEVLQIETDDNYKATTSHDVWQFGIVIFVCLTGCLPWQKAASDDQRYMRYITWHSSALSPIRKQPKLFKLVTSKGQRMFRKLLEPKPDRRLTGLSEVYRYLDDRWMAKANIEKNAGADADDGLCPSMYSFHSSPEEKNKLLHSLIQYGLETTVDREAKKDRIRAWIQNSVIEEEDETLEEEQEISGILSSDEEENIVFHDNETGPAGERLHNRGPISTRRVANGSRADLHSATPLVQNTTAIMLPTPPKKPERHHYNHRNDTKPKIEKVYTPPIDPTIPLAVQKVQTLPNTNLNNNTLPSQIIRNPNAFLVETNSLQNLPQSSNTTYEITNQDVANKTLGHSHSSNALLQSVQDNSSQMNAIQKSQTIGGYMPSQTSNQNYNLNYSTQSLQFPPQNVSNTPQMNNSTNNNNMQANNSQSTISNTPSSLSSNSSIQMTTNQLNNAPKQIIPNLQKNSKTDVSRALANTAFLAISGISSTTASTSNETPKSIDSHVFSEKEKDRNYNVYGINAKSLVNVQNKNVHQSSPPVNHKKSSKFQDNRHVTFSSTPPGSTRSGSK